MKDKKRQQFTTLSITKSLYNKLKSMRLTKRESFDDVIRRNLIIEDNEKKINEVIK